MSGRLAPGFRYGQPGREVRTLVNTFLPDLQEAA